MAALADAWYWGTVRNTPFLRLELKTRPTGPGKGSPAAACADKGRMEPEPGRFPLPRSTDQSSFVDDFYYDDDNSHHDGKQNQRGIASGEDKAGYRQAIKEVHGQGNA